jgi:cell wall-associated NlpC family hydrolase
MSERQLGVTEAGRQHESAAAPSTDVRRLTVIEEARQWLRTPYHHMGRVKGGGTDCLMLLVEVYRATGVIP